jgi:Poly(hydroxyalcanoate) granule associated protein (phasin)
MATVSQRLKGTFDSARVQLEGFEKKAVKQVALLEKKAKASLGDVQGKIDEVPQQLKGAWDQVIDRVRGALDFASNDDLRKLSAKVDDLAKKVEKLIRGDKIKNAASKGKS